MDQRPIGVFDSGLGGLTAVRRLRQLLPEEDIVFLGDTGRVPYGGRSPGTIRRFAEENVSFLLERRVKAAVAACGTISSIAPEKLLGRGIPICGVVEPAVEKALALTEGRVAVIGTEGSIRAGAYERLLKSRSPECRVLARACPLLVPLIEAGHTEPEDPALTKAVKTSLEEIRAFGADTLILGCTHYPLIAGAIRRCLGSGIRLVDVAAEAAEKLTTVLSGRDALARRDRPGELHIWVTGSAGRFAALAGRFLSGPETLCIRHTPPGRLENEE